LSGSNINITANYDENIAAGSTLTVVLDNGESVTLSSISGSSLSGTYTVGTTGSGEDSGDLTVASISSESVSDALANTQTGSSVPGSPNNIADTSTIVIDTTAPSLVEVTAVSTPNSDNTPDYTFSSNEAGTAAYGGSCDSAGTSISSGNNTVTLDNDGAGGVLADATYNDCTVTVTDTAGNASSALAITTFAIDTDDPDLLSFTSSTGNNTYGPTSSINVTATYDKNLEAGSTMTVVLDNGESVTLSSISGATLSGSYTVGATGSGEDSGDLTVTRGSSSINVSKTGSEINFGNPNSSNDSS